MCVVFCFIVCVDESLLCMPCVRGSIYVGVRASKDVGLQVKVGS